MRLEVMRLELYVTQPQISKPSSDAGGDPPRSLVKDLRDLQIPTPAALYAIPKAAGGFQLGIA